MVNSNMISKASMSHEEEKMLFSSLVASELHPQMPQGETRVHRRRKRAKGGGAEGDPKKRRLSDEQVKLLEISFGEERKLELGRKVHLAAVLGLDPKQVAVWFQNRRARHKSKKVEEAYLELKSIHDATVVEKCHLENEVLKLKDKLFEAQEEVRKLSLGVNGAAGGGSNSTGEVTGSPRSSTLTYQPLVAEFGLAEEDAELMYIQEHDLSDYMIEWAYFYGM